MIKKIENIITDLTKLRTDINDSHAQLYVTVAISYLKLIVSYLENKGK